MGIVYPDAGIDSFSVPSNPQATTLSSGGSSARDHTQSHQDLGNAIVAIETNAAPLAHDHSGADPSGLDLWVTSKLAQANTHQSPDTDATIASLHHTIGVLPTQAAAGNHAHDYEGSSVFNKPMVICTSTTRPIDPPVGMLIFETDTNCGRVWSQFPGNTLVSGLNYSYTFNTGNSSTVLDSAIFSQDYVYGTGVTDGAMGAPTASNCTWHVGDNVSCHCVSQAVVDDASVTETDDQVLTWTTGNTQLQGRYFFALDFVEPSPTNDGFLRMSADGQAYVRFKLSDTGATILYTTTGYAGETLLGSVLATTNYKNTTWTAKAVDNTYVLYAAGQQVLAVVDYQNVVSVGPDFRGWGIGMTAAQALFGQLVPCNITKVTIADVPYHTESLIWQLVNFAAVPHIRAEAHFEQVITHGTKGSVVGYDTLITDWLVNTFTHFDVSQTDFTIQETGHYQVHISIPWSPQFFSFDQSALGVSINGQDVGRKTVHFMRGNGFAPGYPQTIELFFTYYFAAGDILRVWAQHNAGLDQWLYYHVIPPQISVAWIELDFMGP